MVACERGCAPRTRATQALKAPNLAPAPWPIAPTIKRQAIGVQIGSHTDDLGAKATWCRLPYSGVKTTWFSAAGGNTLKVASTQGGLVYIVVKRVSFAFVLGDACADAWCKRGARWALGRVSARRNMRVQLHAVACDTMHPSAKPWLPAPPSSNRPDLCVW